MNQNSLDPAAIYSKDYYDHYGSESGAPYDRDQLVWQKHFQTLAGTLVERYQPRTALDVGCAKGFLVECLRDNDVDAFGVDVSPYAISQVREDIRPYCRVASGTEPLSGQFDLITCVEVAEHMPEPEARAMIAEICRHTGQVLFSSTDSGFDEPTHINIHPADYWIALFQEQGFFPDRNFQPNFIAAHAMRFLRCAKPKLQLGVFSHEPPNCAVALLRLAGTIRHLEQQNRMELQWCTAREPQMDIAKLLDSDVFIIHREHCDRRIGVPAIAAARELGKPVVFELDDLLINVPHTNPNHKYCTEITPDVLEMLRDADFVTVTTEPLRRYLEEAEAQARGKVYVLPNFINLDIWDGAKPPPEKPEEPFVIGWFGTATHDEDLAVIKPAIVQIAQKYAGKVLFKFWGYLPKDLEGIPGVKLMRGSQPDLRLHARDVVNSRIDLALAPLLDHPFNHAKSDLKWLEYSICYIPAIYSTISPYTASVEHRRTGWLVDNKPELWIEAMERFIHDHELRHSIAIQAHDEVRAKRCVNVGAEQWDALYRSFHVSGPKPKPATAGAGPYDRAAACLMQHAANAFSRIGDNVQALKMCEAAVAKYAPPGSSQAMLVNSILNSYRGAFIGLKEAAELTASLNAAKTLAESGESKAAIKLYVKTLEIAVKSKNPAIVLQMAVNVAEALQPLDIEQGRRVLDMSAQLATAIKSQPGLLAVERLRLKYRQNVPSSKPPERIKVSGHSGPPSSTRPSAVLTKSVPTVSIIIPVFNNLALTQACLDSIACVPTQVHYEIIVVDNASTDGTAEYLQGRARSGVLHVLTNSTNCGFAHACNQGAQAAKGPLLLFLNNDTRVTHKWMDALVKTARKSNAGVVGAKLLYADATIQHAGIEFINGVPDHPHRHAPADLPAANQLRELDMVTGACLVTPRSVFLELGGFDEVFQNGVEDIDYCLRVRSTGRKVIYDPRAVVYHLEGQSAGRFNHVQENLNIFFARWKNAFDPKGRFVAAKPKTIPAGKSLLLPDSKSAHGASAITISWEGSFLDYGSLSHINRELTSRLAGSLNLTCVGPSHLPASAMADKAMQQCAKKLAAKTPAGTAVTVRHQWPPNWSRPASGVLVVIQPWEYGSLPKAWVNDAVNVDEFWVPSPAVRAMYETSGIAPEKVRVVPNGVDTRQFRPGIPPMPLATKKKFKFLFVGGTIFRKGPDILLEAFSQAFTAADDVCLVIKDFGGDSFYQGQTAETAIQALKQKPGSPEILYLKDEISSEQMPSLYAACHCLVLPYRGEGFGLPVLEAMACGLPVIVTAGGATDSFVSADAGWKIPAPCVQLADRVGDIPLVKPGWMLQPSTPHLVELLKLAAQNPEECLRRGANGRSVAEKRFDWNDIAAEVAHRLKELALRAPASLLNIQTESPPKKAAVASPVIKLPDVARIGDLGEARELFKQKKREAAWNTTAVAIAKRPFHPEAFLLLAEIAAATGDADKARQCAQHARNLAHEWSPAKQFLKKNLKGGAKLEWMKLPDAIQRSKSKTQSLSVCLIVKNEEKFLAQCLKSVREIAQQIIVVDTGSTDRTVEIAKGLGTEIYTHVWSDDFSAARNAALEHATGDWILILDADEELPATQHAKLLVDMKNSGALALRLPLVNRGLEAEGQSFVPRLFRNVPGAYYYGRIHEQVFPSLLPLGKSWGLKAAMGTAEILHHGYDQEMVRDRNKIERNLKLLHLACEENPYDVNLAMNLGLELVRSENLAAGLEKYREAFELMSELPSDEVTPELREVLLTQFTSQLYKVREHNEVVRILTSPLAKAGGLTASLHLALGLSQFELKNYEEAAEQMRQCLAKRKQPALSPINTDILTAMPNHCLALALARTNDIVRAEKAFEAALNEKGLVENVKLDYAKFLASTNRPVEALHKMHELVAADCKNGILWRTGGEIALGRPDFLGFARDWTGEAMHYVPEDPVIAAQRAEALMLSGDTASALGLWERLWSAEPQPRTLAALILCETIESQTPHAPHEPDEPATSRAFITWYQRLIAISANSVILRLNERTDKLSRALPTAARMIEKALAEAQQQTAVV